MRDETTARVVPSLGYWSRTFIVWLAVYPSITVLLEVLGPHLRDAPIPLQTLILSTIMVPLMTGVLVPNLTKIADRILARWSRR